jgi:hypothetical protein
MKNRVRKEENNNKRLIIERKIPGTLSQPVTIGYFCAKTPFDFMLREISVLSILRVDRV